MPTVRDVAREAEVSIATVSHVINGTRYVSPELEKRVRAAMSALDYQPDQIARSLRTQRTNTVGLIISDISNPFFALVARGVETAAAETGFNVIISNTDEDLNKERQYIDVLYERRIDGMLIAPTGGTDKQLKQLVKRNVPLVFVDRKAHGIHADAVLSDNVTGARELTTHLLSYGHRRIGLILGVEGTSANDERRSGFFKAFEEQGLEVDESLMVRGDFRVQGGIRACHELLDLPHPPTAVFSLNNLTAIGVLCAINERNMTYPDDISVVSFDSPWWMDHVLKPRLTYVKQEPYRIGYEAMTRLAHVIQSTSDGHGQSEVLDLRIPTQLQAGESVARIA